MKNIKRFCMLALAAIWMFCSLPALAWEAGEERAKLPQSTPAFDFDTYLSVKASKTVLVFNGNARELPVSLSYNGRELVKGVDYSIAYSYVDVENAPTTRVSGAPTNAGTYNVYFTITNLTKTPQATKSYGSVRLVIKRASQKLTVKTEQYHKIYKAKALAEGGAVWRLGITGISKERTHWWGKGFDAAKAGFEVNPLKGYIRVPAGLARGVYQLCFQNASTENYHASNRLTLTIRVR